MFLTSMAIVGGMVIAGVKVYRERKKEMPSTVATKQPIDKLPVLPKLNGPVTANSEFKREKINPFFDRRHEQLSEISQAEDVNETSEAEKKMDRYLTISVTCFGMTTVGSLLYPPLSLLSVPGLVYLSSFFFKRSYELIRQEGKVAVALVDSLSFGGTLITGHYFACSLAYSFFYFSRKLLIKTEDHSQKSLQNIFSHKPASIWVQQGDVEIEIAFDSLQIGDIVVIQAGQTIPVDGMITSGAATIDQRTLTGESQPVEKEVGEPVFASTLVLSGKIYIQVEKAGQDTVAAQIGDILNSTADFKSNILSRGEKIIEQGARPTLALSALALPLLGTQSALATLYTAFGYHMRSAAPISVLNFLNMASENGILIKDGRSLELLSEVDTFVFDKTGTLTLNEPHVGTIYTCHGSDENDLLTYAAAAEDKQIHPLALAIQKEADNRKLNVPPIGEAKVELGYGLKVRTLASEEGEEQLIRVGSGRFMVMESIAIPNEYQQIEENAHENGHSLVYVAIDDQLGGAIELVPTIRPEAKQIINDLHQRKIKVVIISGDHEKPTKKLALKLGIDHYFAETLPQNKADIVEQLQNEGKSVCFVGDGINDSIALKKANVSISLRGASTAATDTASIILMDESLKQLVPLLNLASELDANLSNSVVLTVVPGIISAGGIFFFHLGLVSSIIWCNVALVASLSNAMLPLIKPKKAPFLVK
jgi:Cu2+-exporting ATPase